MATLPVSTVNQPTVRALESARPILDLARNLGLTVRKIRARRMRNSTNETGWTVHSGRDGSDEVWVYFWGRNSVRCRVWFAHSGDSRVVTMLDALRHMRRIAEERRV